MTLLRTDGSGPKHLGRWIAGILAAAFASFGALVLLGAREMAHRLAEAETAVLADLAADVSRTGEHPGRFVSKFSLAHGHIVGILLPQQALQGSSPTQLLAGFEASLQLLETGGTNVVRESGPNLVWGDRAIEGFVPLFMVTGRRRGTNDFRVVVTEPAPALAKVSQRLQVRYELCGLERLQVCFVALVGAAGLFVGLLIGLLL